MAKRYAQSISLTPVERDEMKALSEFYKTSMTNTVRLLLKQAIINLSADDGFRVRYQEALRNIRQEREQEIQ